MKEYLVIDNSEYKIKLLVDETNLDYYTDMILELYTAEGTFVLLKDNIVFFVNMINAYIKNIDNYNLDERLDEKKLGLLFNEYYYCTYKDITSDYIILDNQDSWIGEKYCCFSNSEYATWIYKRDDDIFMKVTPMFKYFDEDNNTKKYLEFVEEYSDILSTVITFQQLKKISEILLDLYSKL